MTLEHDIIDRRRRMEEPLPVHVVAVADVRLVAVAGLECKLDEFYAQLLGFQRESSEEGLVYRAENVRLRLEVMEGPVDDRDMRALGLLVPSLAELEKQLIERQIEYQRHRGLMPGQESLLLKDPAGNWLEIGEIRAIG